VCGCEEKGKIPGVCVVYNNECDCLCIQATSYGCVIVSLRSLNGGKFCPPNNINNSPHARVKEFVCKAIRKMEPFTVITKCIFN
jgi:hypothetical protein